MIGDALPYPTASKSLTIMFSENAWHLGEDGKTTILTQNAF